MASSESQGKTISLVIFVILTIVTSCTAYYFWDQTDALTRTAEEAKKNERAAKDAERAAKENFSKIRELTLGTVAEENQKAILDAMNQELQNPKTAPQRKQKKGAYQNYTDAVNYLHNELAESDRRVTGLEQKNDELEKELKAIKDRYQKEVDVARQAQEDKNKELASETAKFNAELEKLKEETRGVSEQYTLARDRVEQLQRDLDAKTKVFAQETKNKNDIIASLERRDVLAKQLEFEHEDGKITHVIEAGTKADINLGSADSLSKGVTFGVYGRDVGGNPYELPKANAEVVDILGEHRARVKLHSNSLGNPVLAGDLLYNPVWDRGDKQPIALVGRVYLDNDDEPDNDQFMQLVEKAGGKVITYVDLKTGKIVGPPLNVNTSWLVVGDIPEPTENEYKPEEVKLNAAIMKSSSDLRKQARDHGVRELNIRNFLAYMGNQILTNTVPAGREDRILFQTNKRNRKIEKLEDVEKAASPKK